MGGPDEDEMNRYYQAQTGVTYLGTFSLEEFIAITNNTEIIGVSRESIKSHENFKEKQSFPFELLSDPDEKVCKAYDVMKLKSMYGREYIGVDRSTFIIDANSKLVKEWRGVKVKGHADEVLNFIQNLD